MSEVRLIRYTTHPERAEENAALIRDVFAELADSQPEGLGYLALRLDDGVSFMHVVSLDAAENPLAASDAFAAFQATIADRLSEGPAALAVTIVGSYGGLSA
jgi:hypothetical protein